MPSEFTLPDLAWFVGLFEGEGCFFVAANRRPKGLVIQMTDQDVLEKVQRLFGGVLKEQAARKKNPHYKIIWRWALGVHESRELVDHMLPMLGARRSAQAERFMKVFDETQQRISSKKQLLKARDRQIEEWLDSEVTVSEIARRLQLSRQSVYRGIARISATSQSYT